MTELDSKYTRSGSVKVNDDLDSKSNSVSSGFVEDSVDSTGNGSVNKTSDSKSTSSNFVSFEEMENKEKDNADNSKHESNPETESVQKGGAGKEKTKDSDSGLTPPYQVLVRGVRQSFIRLRSMVTGNYRSTENSRLLPDRQESHGSNESSGPHGGHSMHHPGSSSEQSYEELFKDSAPCPSCRGLGRVPKDQANQLVALIPLSDDRLKPRRTVLWVAMAVGLCAIAAGLLLFFLMPRDIIISSNKPFLQPNSIDINPQAMFANFTVTNRYNVSNSNFYAVEISGVFMKALYSNAIIAQAYAYRKEPLDIGPRDNGQLFIDMDFVLSGEHGSLVSHCMSNWSWIHNLPILFEVTTNYTYMGHSEQATLTTFQTVSCHPPPPPVPPLTTAPPVTIPSTTSTPVTTVPTTKPAAPTTKPAEPITKPAELTTKPEELQSPKVKRSDDLLKDAAGSIPLKSAHSHKDEKPV